MGQDYRVRVNDYKRKRQSAADDGGGGGQEGEEDGDVTEDYRGLNWLGERVERRCGTCTWWMDGRCECVRGREWRRGPRAATDVCGEHAFAGS